MESQTHYCGHFFQNKLILTPHNRIINWAAVILLVFFAIFEGFDSTNRLFIDLRGISLAIFIIVPILFVLTNKPGLQRLLIVSENGELIYGFDFGKKLDLFSDGSESDLDNAVMTAGFLAAITGFSGQIAKGNSSFSIKTGGFYFTLIKSGKALFALQSLNPSKALDKNFIIFTQKIDPLYLIPNLEIKKTESPLKPLVQKEFKPFF